MHPFWLTLCHGLTVPVPQERQKGNNALRKHAQCKYNERCVTSQTFPVCGLQTRKLFLMKFFSKMV